MRYKNRIFFYDLLRAIAIIFVIVCHVTQYADPLNAGLKVHSVHFLHYIGVMGVPLFFMISGALLLNRDYTLSDFFKKRFSRVFYPFVFWVIIILGVGLLYFDWSYTHAWKYFIGKHSILWYIWALISVYLCIPIINSFLKEHGLKALEYFLVIWGFTMILKNFNMYPLLPHLDFSYFATFMGYFVLGYYLDNKDFKINLSILSIGIFLVSLVLAVYYDINNIHVLKPSYMNILNIIMATGIFLLIKYLCSFNSFDAIKNKLIGKIIVSISICSYGMYYVHALLNLFIKDLDIHNNKFMLLAFFALVLGSWGLTYLVSKIPYMKRFSGV